MSTAFSQRQLAVVLLHTNLDPIQTVLSPLLLLAKELFP